MENKSFDSEPEREVKILKKPSDSFGEAAKSREPSPAIRQKVGVLLDGQLRILSVSPSFSRILGRGEKDLSGKFFVSLVHKSDRVGAREKMKDLFRPPYNCHVEMRLPANGGWRRLEWAFRSELAEEGEILAVIGTGRDAAEQESGWNEFDIKVRKDETLARLGSLALKCTDLSEFFDSTCELVAKALSADYVDILELLPDQERLLLRSSSCREDGWVGKRTVGLAENTLSGFCLMSKKPVFVEDILSETRLSGSKVLLSRGVVSGFTTIIG
jgi:PAS domain S-box-containing protein